MPRMSTSTGKLPYGKRLVNLTSRRFCTYDHITPELYFTGPGVHDASASFMGDSQG